MIALCLGMAGSVWATLPLQSFTLAWQHTVEKVLWEEDYRLSERGLLLEEARVRGSGAGWRFPRAPCCVTAPGITTVGAAVATVAAGAHTGGRRLPDLPSGRCDALARWIGPPDPERPAVELWACPIRDPSD